MAELGDAIVGSFGMLKSPLFPKYDLDLVKFAVDPSIQGKGIGRLLIEACLAKAKDMGAKKLFIESNRRCGAAVHLYKKHGFVEIPLEKSEYARCDIQLVYTF